MQEKQKDRQQLIMEWLRCNESFKRLAREYGKKGVKPEAAPSEEDPDEPSAPSKPSRKAHGASGS